MNWMIHFLPDNVIISKKLSKEETHYRWHKINLNPGLHIVVMVVNTVVNMFLTLFQAVLIHVNTLITTSQA